MAHVTQVRIPSLMQQVTCGVTGAASSAAFGEPMHTGQLDGINNKIKAIKRMACGYRDGDYFFLKIKAAFPGNP